MSHLVDCSNVSKSFKYRHRYLLVEEDFAVLHTSFNLLADSSDAELICLRTLEEPTVATKNVAHAVLGGSIEFWRELVNKFSGI